MDNIVLSKEMLDVLAPDRTTDDIEIKFDDAGTMHLYQLEDTGRILKHWVISDNKLNSAPVDRKTLVHIYEAKLHSARKSSLKYSVWFFLIMLVLLAILVPYNIYTIYIGVHSDILLVEVIKAGIPLLFCDVIVLRIFLSAIHSIQKQRARLS